MNIVLCFIFLFYDGML